MYLNKAGIEEIELRDKRILIREDYNVPAKNGVILDNTFVKNSLESIKHALGKGAKSVVLISHMGCPGGKRIEEYSLKPVAEELKKLLSMDVSFLPDCVGPKVEELCANPPPCSVLLLENLCFHEEEEGSTFDSEGKVIKTDSNRIAKYRESLSKLGDIFVNDAFGLSHKDYSSLSGINIPVRVAGIHMKKDLDYFSKALKKQEGPFLAIVGGRRLKSKIHIIDQLLDVASEIALGSGLAFTFLKDFHNMEIGNSLYEEGCSESVRKLMEKAKKNNIPIHLPMDFIIANKFSEWATRSYASVESGIPSGWMGLDCGPNSVSEIGNAIDRSKMVVWNGPIGLCEWENFCKGTVSLMDKMVKATKKGTLTIIGGGVTAALFNVYEMSGKVSHVTTGGEACLQLCMGKKLPGITTLNNVK